MDAVRERLAGDAPVLLDGGLATELEHAGAQLRDELWSARLLVDDPDAIRAAHARFASAGAQVLTTASYQASAAGFARLGLDEAQTVRLLARSVVLAREAADQAAREGGVRPLVAASVGPYGAVLADGSEYRGGYGRSVEELTAFQRPRVAALVAAGPDLLACETLPSPEDAQALLAVLDEHPGTPAWFSFTTPDGVHVSQGEPLREVAVECATHPQVVAVGVNCCASEVVERALDQLPERAPAVVYPNLGGRWDPAARRWTRPTRRDDSDPRSWAAAGAVLIGGCCGTTPADIAALGQRLKDRLGGSRGRG